MLIMKVTNKNMTETFARINQESSVPDSTVLADSGQGESLAVNERKIHQEIVLDEQSFERTQFDIYDDVSVVFKGLEELPTFPDQEQITEFVVDYKQRPIRTSGDDFGEWLDRATDGQPFADPFERASESGQRIRLIANSTPLGVARLAKFLSTQMGVGNEDASGKLAELEQKLDQEMVDDQVQGFLDQIYACSVVDSTGTRERPSELGLLEVAFALTGDVDAKKVVAAKEKTLELLDSSSRGQKTLELNRDPETESLVEPGTMLAKEQLVTIKDQHFVAVHTTGVKPYSIDQEDSEGPLIMRPTAGFGSPSEIGYYPRASIHFSLNHTVESHIQGDFSDRAFTLVSPLEDLVAYNGVPAALNGVDTYFVSRPGEGVFLPENTSVVEMHATDQASLIEKQGRFVRINEVQLDVRGLEDLASFVEGNYPELYDIGAGDDYEISNELKVKLLAEKIAKNTELNIDFLDLDENISSSDPAHFEQVKQYRTKVAEALQTIMTVTGIEKAPIAKEEGREMISNALELFLSGEADLTGHKGLQSFLGEAIRKTVVELEILQRNGDVVQSDGMSAYIETSGFDERVYEVAKKIGAPTGLHVYNPEGNLEFLIGSAISDANKTNQAPDGEAYTEFDWTKFDSSMLWSALQGCSRQVRQTIVRTGMLTYAKRQNTSLGSDSSVF
jgi:hypothetical protein